MEIFKGVEEKFISQQPGHQSLFCFLEMVTGSKGNTNMMLVMEWVVDFVMDFVMVKVVIKGVEE